MQPAEVTIDGASLTREQVHAVAMQRARVNLAPAATERVQAARAVVDRMATGSQAVYGVNTGFGMLADVRIDADKVHELQYNLIRSHAAGVGRPLSEPIVRTVMLLRANVMAGGYTGVRVRLLEAFLALLNSGVTPVVPSRGSVGASGDLAPLSHLALVLIGEGEAFYGGRQLPGALALKLAGLDPVQLEAKEGLSLVNGTQVMTAVGLSVLRQFDHLAKAADIIGAMTVEGMLGTPSHFNQRITDLRPHPGAIDSAANMRALLADSEIAASHAGSDHRVQDPYSLRCIPQVHGAARDAGTHVSEILSTEINACTDNPLVLTDEDRLLSCGNFHGQPLSLAMDYLGCALATLGVISERRTEQMVNPKQSEDLPAFLAKDAGLESGFMMAHVTAAALVNESKSVAHPASVDSIPTSAGQEDHVSMGVTAALKSRHIMKNTARILAIELMVAGRALDFRAPRRPGTGVAAAHALLRESYPAKDGDEPVGHIIDELAKALRTGWLTKAVETAGIQLN